MKPVAALIIAVFALGSGVATWALGDLYGPAGAAIGLGLSIPLGAVSGLLSVWADR